MLVDSIEGKTLRVLIDLTFKFWVHYTVAVEKANGNLRPCLTTLMIQEICPYVICILIDSFKLLYYFMPHYKRSHLLLRLYPVSSRTEKMSDQRELIYFDGSHSKGISQG